MFANLIMIRQGGNGESCRPQWRIMFSIAHTAPGKLLGYVAEKNTRPVPKTWVRGYLE